MVPRTGPSTTSSSSAPAAAPTSRSRSIDGARHIDAVEIDPAIQQIGVERAPRPALRRPAGHALSSTTVGRFLRTTDKKYDLVVFALPDSLTLVSTAANVRLESFLFTEEAFASVRDHLEPGRHLRALQLLPRAVAGRRSSSACSRTPSARHRWSRTYANVQAALAAGPARRRARRRRAAGRRRRRGARPWPSRSRRRPPTTGRSCTCATPIRRALLPASPWPSSCCFAAARGRRRGARATSTPHPALQPALLRPGHRLPAARDAQPGQLQPALRHDLAGQRAGLLRHPGQRPGGDPRSTPASRSGSPNLLLRRRCSCRSAVAFLLPPEQLLIDPPWLRYVLAAVLAFAPVFFANLVFSHSFRDTDDGRHGLRQQPARARWSAARSSTSP